MNYNETITDFLRQNGIDPTNVSNDVNRALNSHTKETVLASYLYALYKPNQIARVSVKDLFGTETVNLRYERKPYVRLFDLLCDYFDRDGDGYHRRSVDLLNYSASEISKKLESSFQNDPVHLIEVNQKYYVTVNGNHRSFVLLFHYLNSARTGSEMQNQFELQAQVRQLDLELSGMIFLLKMKFGSRVKLCSESIRNGLISLAFDGQPYEIPVEEFKEKVRQEMSPFANSFEDLRTLYFVLIGNAKIDPHFKKAMDGVFVGFSKIDLDKLKVILNYTFGYESEIEEILYQNQTFEEYIEKIKNALLEHKLRALKQGIKEKQRLDRENKELEIVEANLKRTLEELEVEMGVNQFLEFISSLDATDIVLEEEEKKAKKELEMEKQKLFSSRKKKRLLEERLNELESVLDAVYFKYEGFSYTLRDFCRLYKKAQKRPKQDLFTEKLSLEQELFSIQMAKTKNIHLEDCMFQLDSLRRFCSNCEIDFEELIKRECLGPAVEEIEPKRR